MHYCYSCSAPLDNPEFAGPVANYCKFCVDDNGAVKEKELIQAGIAEWLKSWGPTMDDETAFARAGEYMKAMPHWA